MKQVTVFIHLKSRLGYKTHSKLSKTIVTSERNEKGTPGITEILLTIFALLTTICFQKLIITVLPFSKQKQKSHTLQTIA